MDRRRLLVPVVLLGLLPPFGCDDSTSNSTPEEIIHCTDDLGCPPGYHCESFVCVPSGADADVDIDADVDGDTDGDTDSDVDLDLDGDTDTDTDADGDTDVNCQDGDGDGYGSGPDCLGLDCDDSKAGVNPSAEEVCDGDDNDCDGRTDEDVTAPPGTCLSQGVCAGASAECRTGAWECHYPTTYESGSETTCDSLDNDCDGEVDEGLGDCACNTGDTRPCGLDIGECEQGVQLCVDASWGPCDGIGPTDETCDGRDNDCDGATDESGDLAPPPNSCHSQGVCAGADLECRGRTGWACMYPTTYESGAEKTCDGLDNDCDGEVDEELEDCDACNEGDTLPCSTDQGECTAGVTTCSGGVWSACSGVEPEDEVCDGRDEDCDGTVDNHLTDAPPDCLTAGVCAGTIPTCAGGWSCPYPASHEAGDETSCDGLDNDCDGDVDEGLVQGGGDCSLTAGVCAEAVPVCDADGTPVCGYPDTHEAGDEVTCDGLDNDCDGDTDEGLSPPPGACLEVGVCAGHPAPTCLGAGGWDCGYAATYEAGDEVTCDDLDNDCDGDVDEGLDRDGDTHLDCHDNCPDTPNEDQADQNGNGVGDACEVTCQRAERLFSGDHVEADTTGETNDYNGETRTNFFGDHTGGCPPVGSGIFDMYGLGNMNGPDKAYEVELTAGQTLHVSASAVGDWVMAVYIVTECDDPNGDSCQLWSTEDTDPQTIDGVALVEQDFLIIVDGFQGASGPFTLDVEITDPLPGEVCASAVPLTLGETVVGNTSGMQNDHDERGCAATRATGPDVFYGYTHDTAGSFVAAAASTNWDISLYLFQDCADIADSCVGGSDGSSKVEVIDFTADAGAPVVVAVDGYSGASGPYAVSVFDPAAQGRATCAAAEAIALEDVRIGDTRTASNDHQACETSPGPDHTYAFTPAATEVVEVTAMPAAGFDVVLYAFTDCGNPDGSCEQAADRGSGGQSETISFTAQAGTTYYLTVDGYGANSKGVYALRLTTP